MATRKLHIDNYVSRSHVVTALADSGYKVWIETVKHGSVAFGDTEYYVCYEEKVIKKG